MRRQPAGEEEPGDEGSSSRDLKNGAGGEDAGQAGAMWCSAVWPSWLRLDDAFSLEHIVEAKRTTQWLAPSRWAAGAPRPSSGARRQARGTRHAARGPAQRRR